MSEGKINWNFNRMLMHVDQKSLDRIENKESKNRNSNNKEGTNRANRKKESDNNKSDMIEIWEDVVSLKELVLSFILCLFTSFSGYYLAPDKEPWPLLCGLLGAILGFVISSLIIKPKRVLLEESEEFL